MKIKQFEDKGLSHFSYAVLSDEAKVVVLIDPARNVEPYIAFAEEASAKIVAVIETHPHADFVSGHLELHNRFDAVIYCSSEVDATYPHTPFDEGDEIAFGELTFRALNTPGHSPDSISVVLAEHSQDTALFSGDTLFIGDCGRPDLRESAGSRKKDRKDLAAAMYHSLRAKIMTLADEVILYPAHGAGTLCGKSLSAAESSTIGQERETNWSVQDLSEADFIKELLSEQPFVPKYFPYDVDLNRKGAPNRQEAIKKVLVTSQPTTDVKANTPIIDGRPQQEFKKGYLPGAINLQNGGKFETWLGSMVGPGEAFYLAAASSDELQALVEKVAKIGYEPLVLEAFLTKGGEVHMDPIPLEAFKVNPQDFTIVDVRNRPESIAKPLFENAIVIPLHELRESVGQIPTDKAIVVHCAGGYRSAAASSVIAAVYPDVNVYDLGEEVQNFQPINSLH